METEKVHKTPIYTRKAQDAYIKRQKEADPEAWKARKQAISKQWYAKNKERLREKYQNNKIELVV